jgi:glycosyltransferase involved in cell wall biosynthesis
MSEFRALLITNLNTHYRDRLFTLLRELYGIDFEFYSDGREPYWAGEVLPVSHLGARYLPGFWIGRTRIVPRLIWDLVRSDHNLVICTAGGKFVLPLVWFMTRIRRRRLILWTGVWQRPHFMMHRLAGPAVDFMFRDADAVVAYGSHVAKSLKHIGVQPDRIFLAPQAIDNSRFLPAMPPHAIARFRDSIGLSPDDAILLYVGRLAPSKGVLTLLRAFANLGHVGKNLVLLIAGSGPLGEELKAAAAELGLAKNVRFLGRRSNQDLPTIYQSADIVIVPSEPTREGAEPWGLVVNEAMASGAAVVVSDAVGAAAHGLPEDGKSGLVFRSGDATSLASVLTRLLAEDDLRAKLRFNATRQVGTFTYEAMALGIMSAVNFAIGRHRSVKVVSENAETTVENK